VYDAAGQTDSALALYERAAGIRGFSWTIDQMVYYGTNLEIANHTERRLLGDWGYRFWILNLTRPSNLKFCEPTFCTRFQARRPSPFW